MRSLRSAAALLAAANSVDALTPILTGLGFAAARPLDPPSLGLTVPCTTVHVARGAGALRALVIVTESQTVQETTARTAAQLARRAPHLLWLLIVIDGAGAGLAIAAWAADRLSPRVAALVVDRGRVVDSDADTLCALEAVAALGDDSDGTLTHARWVDVLGRFGVDRRFFRAIERAIDAMAAGAVGDASMADRSEIALLYTCRILFLAFLPVIWNWLFCRGRVASLRPAAPAVPVGALLDAVAGCQYSPELLVSTRGAHRPSIGIGHCPQ